MPIYLPPISRRRFITGSAAAAAALAFGQGCALPSRKKNPHSIALLSDIHIAANPLTVARSVNMTNNLKQATAEIIAWPDQPGTIFLNGDMAFNNGYTEDYAAVIGLLQPLREAGFPLHLNVGNHDDREHFWQAMPFDRTIPENLPGRQASIVKLEDANWFMLDSLIKTLTTPGKLGEAQLAWLAAALDANPDKPAIILVHHQSGPLAPGKRGGGLEDAEEFLAIIRPRRQVKAYVFGHTHTWSVKQDESGIHLVNLPTTAYLFQEGHPNGWVHASMRPDGMKIELRCLDHTRKDHGETHTLAWRA